MHTYDPSNHVITFGAILLDSGYGTDTFIEVSRQSNAWDDDAGTDGEVTRSKTNDDRATVSVTLMRSSFKNDELSAHYNLDKLTPGGIGARPFQLADIGGNTKIRAERAWIRKSPDPSLGRKVGEVTWEIRLAKIQELHGGINA